MKVVVIEDEIKIRTGLVKLIRKLKPNYELIVEAKDGVEGYSLIKQINPEIVFLDINMPKLNGLEMLKKLNDLEITRRTIILSGYSEFEYAQTAIRLGVKEYLLKPITIDDLTLTLDTIEKDILQQSLFGISYKESDKQNKQTLEKLINGTSSDLEEVGLYMNKILGFLLENNFTIINLYYGKHHERYYSEIKNLLSIIKKQSNDPFFFAILDNQYQWLIIQQDKIINTPDSRLLSKLKQLGEDIIISVITVPNFQEIKTAIMANECNRKWSITLKDEQVIVEDLIRNVQDSVETFVYPIGIERKANSAISSSTPWLASDFIIEFKDQITQTIFHPKEILDNCFRFFSAILHSAVLVHRGFFSQEKNQQLLNELMNVQTPNELEDMFYNFIKIFKELEPSNNSLVVYKAISLIKDKYEEGISLKEIANELNVTPEYLSSLFNKETGKSFTLYLKQLRIHKAQEYLTKSEMKSYEIGEKIGYTDPKYFTKVFKEITGITPATYKKLNKTK